VKSHLVPHCHYLKSLGISEEQLPQLILSRPQVLVSNVDRGCLQQRQEVGPVGGVVMRAAVSDEVPGTAATVKGHKR
jgi:hypothetical protein